MARGFGATFGAGATDSVATTYSSTGSDSRSWSIWSWRNGNGGSNRGRLWDKRTTGGSQEVIHYYANVPNNYFFDAQWSISPGQWSIVAPTTGAWHHTLITYNKFSAVNNPIIYLDGSAVSVTINSAPSGTIVTNTDAYVIGNRTNDNVANWDGKLADFAIWDDAILTASEALALARGARPTSIRKNKLVGWWPLDGLQSPEPDLSGGVKNGTVSGATFGIGPAISMFTPRWPRNYDPTAVTVPLSQTHFRFRTDTGAVDGTPTWGDAEDAA